MNDRILVLNPPVIGGRSLEGALFWANALQAGTSIGKIMWALVNSAFTQSGSADALFIQKSFFTQHYWCKSFGNNTVSYPGL
jgi:hypothetical protein